MSNQWRVLSGTPMRSPCSHRTSYTLSPMCSVNWPAPATKKRTSSSLCVCSFRNFCGIVAFQADDVDGLIAFLVHQPIDVGAVGRDDFVLARTRRDRFRCFPLLEA